MATFDLNDLQTEKGFSPMKAYGRSKFANIVFTYELARRLENSGVTVNALHPGHVATDIWKTNFSLVGPLFKWIMGFFALTPEEGADTTIFLASSPSVEGVTGKYFVKREPVSPAAISYDEKIARRLWDLSEELVEIQK